MHTSPEDLALLALGEPSGTPADRDHVAACPECSTELVELTRLTGLGRSMTEQDALSTPSAQVWERIATELGFQSVELPEPGDQRAASTGPMRTGGAVGSAIAAPPPVRRDTARPSRARRAAALAAAAGLALIAGIGIGSNLDKITGPDRSVIAQAPLRPLPQWTGANGSAEVSIDEEGNRVLTIQLSVPQQPRANRQVWLMDENIRQMTNLGFLTGVRGTYPMPNNLDLRRYRIVDVSNEPIADGDPRHSGDSVVRGQLTL